MVPKRNRAPRLCGRGLGGLKKEEAQCTWSGGVTGPKTEEAWARGPRWSHNGACPHAYASGASVVPQRKRPPSPGGLCLGGPKTKETPPRLCGGGGRWSQSGASAHAITKKVTAYQPPPLPWTGSIYMGTHTHDITQHTTAYNTTHHRVQTPHSMPQPAKHPTNNASCQTTQPATQPTHHSTNHTGNPIARYPTAPHHTTPHDTKLQHMTPDRTT